MKQNKRGQLFFPASLFYTLLLALNLSFTAHADELVPQRLAFYPPDFLAANTALDAGNSTNIIRNSWHYAAKDNDPRTSQRLLIVSVQETGATADSEKVAALQQMVSSTRNAKNISVVTDAMVAGRAAWRIAYQTQRPFWQEPNAALFPCEVYWVKIPGSRVVEIKLVADSAEHLQTLKTCLPRFKFSYEDSPR